MRGLAQWAEPLAPFAPFLVAIVAVAAWEISRRSLRQRELADRHALIQREAADDRSQWWQRVESAVAMITNGDRAFSSSGFMLLQALINDPKIVDEDKKLLRKLITELAQDLGESVVSEEQVDQQTLRRFYQKQEHRRSEPLPEPGPQT